MKTERWGGRPIRRDELRDELVHDTYKSGRKLAEPSRCPDCGAVYHRGRWTWDESPAGAAEATCPVAPVSSRAIGPARLQQAPNRG